MHRQILVFCEKLRVARGLPTRSHLDPKQFSLETRVSRAKPILGHTTTINAVTGTPLADILERPKQPAGTEFLIDRPALAAAGVNENTPTKLRSEHVMQGVVLRQLFGAAGSGVAGHRRQHAANHLSKGLGRALEVEFYPLGKRAAAQPPAAVIEQIRAGVQGAVWGDGVAAGTMCLDPPSQCLIVLQTQPVQEAIEAILSQAAK